MIFKNKSKGNYDQGGKHKWLFLSDRSRNAIATIRAKHIPIIILLISSLFLIDSYLPTVNVIEKFVKAEEGASKNAVFYTTERSFRSDLRYYTTLYRQINEIEMDITPVFQYVVSFKITLNNKLKDYATTSPRDLSVFPIILILINAYSLYGSISGKISANREMRLFVLSFLGTLIFFVVGITQLA